MSKTFKRLFSLVLAGCMTVGMCVSASAATNSPTFNYYTTSANSRKRLIISNNQPRTGDSTRRNSTYLNCLVDGNPYDGVNVTTAARSAWDPAQDWIMYRGRDNIATLRPYGQYATLTLFRDTNNGNNARIIAFANSGYSLSNVNMDELEYVSSGKWRLSLTRKNSYVNMSSNSVYGGYNVNWVRDDSQDARIVWEIIYIQE